MSWLEQDQAQLFYSFCLEEVVPDDHQVRAIASVLDLSWVYGELSPHYPALGRPRSSSSNDPDADPRLRLRPAVGAFALSRGQGQSGVPPVLRIEHRREDSGPFGVLGARNERFGDNDVFRQVFEHVVQACISAGAGRWQAVRGRCEPDRGDANKQRSIPGSEWIKQRDPRPAEL